MTEMKKASRKRRKRHDRLQILAEASLAQHIAWWRTLSPNFKNFGTHFSNFDFFWPKHRFFSSTRRATWRALMIGSSSWVKICIFGFFMKIYACLHMDNRFWQVLGFQKGQKHPKTDLSTPFGNTWSSVGRNHFWRGKWKPNSEISLVLESRHADLSNKLNWSQFGHREGLHNQLQTGATHWGFLLILDSVTLFFA